MSDQEADVWEAWNIRDFPRRLRQEIVTLAKDRRQSPGQFAAAYFAALQAAGWPDNPFANGATGELDRAVAHAAQLAAAGLKPPGWLTSGVWRQIAAKAGVTPPARRIGTKPAGLLTDRRQSWQENGHLAREDA